jgi:hypothetical protein
MFRARSCQLWRTGTLRRLLAVLAEADLVEAEGISVGRVLQVQGRMGMGGEEEEVVLEGGLGRPLELACRWVSGGEGRGFLKGHRVEVGVATREVPGEEVGEGIERECYEYHDRLGYGV